MRHVDRIGMILLVLLLTGCSAVQTVKGLFVSGVSLEAVGVQFAEVSEQVTKGCEQKVVPQTTCEKYRAFGLNFKRVYPLAVGMWEAARRANDAATQRKAEDVMRSLSNDLTTLTAEALGSFTPGSK